MTFLSANNYIKFNSIFGGHIATKKLLFNSSKIKKTTSVFNKISNSKKQVRTLDNLKILNFLSINPPANLFESIIKKLNANI